MAMLRAFNVWSAERANGTALGFCFIFYLVEYLDVAIAFSRQLARHTRTL